MARPICFGQNKLFHICMWGSNKEDLQIYVKKTFDYPTWAAKDTTVEKLMSKSQMYNRKD